MWAFNILGSADLLNAFYQGNRIGLAPGQQGAAYFIPTVLVPLLLITHGLVFRLLLKREVRETHESETTGKMKYFLYKLIPLRPAFPADMTPAEAKLMQGHSAYWRHLMDKGLVVIFGPVSDPKGADGIAVVQLEDDADANVLGTNDPTIKANVGFKFEVYSMPQVVLPASRA